VAPAATIRAGSTVVWWNNQAGNYPPLMQRWADQYTQKTGVKVEITAGMTDFETKITAALAAGSPPDLFRYSPGDMPLPGMIERNALRKLDPYVRRDNYDLADFRKEAVALYRWKGSLYAIPRDYGLQLLFYNSDRFTREGIA
jgi:multiple sugar transport system substrate-binding protein